MNEFEHPVCQASLTVRRSVVNLTELPAGEQYRPLGFEMGLHRGTSRQLHSDKIVR